MGVQNSKELTNAEVDHLCVLDNAPSSKVISLQKTDTPATNACPPFHTRTLRSPTMAPCYVMRDIVCSSVGLKVNVHRLYNCISDTLGSTGRVSMWDCVRAMQTHGDAVLEVNNKRQFKKIINHYRFVRPDNVNTAKTLVTDGRLVAGVWSTKRVPVTIYGHTEEGLLVKMYGTGKDSSLVKEDVVTNPEDICCMWALVKKRSPVTKCLL